ncbi:MAG: hypothetical protein QF661_10425 [Arenicellales bacterium]|nr:hypothetical protein [Arenicellales bacterium]MDP7617971.1 hypothetical protein [Arenicellales bacterium]
MSNNPIWSLPTPFTHNLCASAGALSFVGGAGDFDSTGALRNPGDMTRQITGTVENVAAALHQEHCSLADAVRVKAFYRPEANRGEISIVQALQDAFPNEPSPVVSTLPVPLQPFKGQEIQVQVIAVRNWRTTGDFQVETQPLQVAGDNTSAHPVVTTALRAGEFIAVANRTAAHFNTRFDAALDGAGQSHIIMPSLQNSLTAVGASLQDSVKMEGYYFGTTRKDWAPLAQARASYFSEPGPPATVVPCHTLWPDKTATKIEVLAMRERRHNYNKYIPREDAWPDRVWDWPLSLPYRQAQRLRGMIWLGGQVPAEPFSNTGKRVLSGQLLPQTRFTMSYIDDLLRPFGRSPADLKLMVCYYTASAEEDVTPGLLQLLRDCCGGVLPPVTLVPVPHMQTADSTVEIWGVAQG